MLTILDNLIVSFYMLTNHAKVYFRMYQLLVYTRLPIWGKVGNYTLKTSLITMMIYLTSDSTLFYHMQCVGVCISLSSILDIKLDRYLHISS